MFLDELEGIWQIVYKDLRAYYFKPPNISWGILFPLVLALAFTLRSPEGLSDLSPGLIAMSALFGTTSMEAIVVTFEKRVGALERLLLAPISLHSIIFSKILGGAIFGLVISGVMTLVSLAFLGGMVMNPFLFTVSLILTTLTLSALGSLIAVSVEEVFEAQTLSNYFRFPMIFLCGVFLPLEAMPKPIRLLAHILPLTYSVEAIEQNMSRGLSMTTYLTDIVALSLFLIAFTFLAVRLLRKGLK